MVLEQLRTLGCLPSPSVRLGAPLPCAPLSRGACESGENGSKRLGRGGKRQAQKKGFKSPSVPPGWVLHKETYGGVSQPEWLGVGDRGDCRRNNLPNGDQGVREPENPGGEKGAKLGQGRIVQERGVAFQRAWERGWVVQRDGLKSPRGEEEREKGVLCKKETWMQRKPGTSKRARC